MRRVCFVVLVMVPFALLPFTGADAKKGGGGNNKGGSERSQEVRQNGDNNGGGGGGGGTGTPDAGDNMHPSGNDKSVEPGGSYPQGHSQSDPDGMSNGGADKPGGSGGIDQGDQDGNNGCGNDDDFEDDNNGLCLGQKKAVEAAPQPAPEPATDSNPSPFTPQGTIDHLLVLPESAVAYQAEPAPAYEGGTSVLGAVEEAGAKVLGAVQAAGTGTLSTAGGLLPKTGAGIMTLVFGGIALLGAGLAMKRFAR